MVLDKNIKRIIVISGIALVLAIMVLYSSVRIVNAGSVQVVTSFGRVTGRILEPGMHLITPFADDTFEYNTRKVIYETTSADKQHVSSAQYKDFPVDTNTKDGQQVIIYYTVRFSVDPAKVTWVAQNIGDELKLVDTIVKTDSRIWARNIPREFEAEHLYTGNVQEVQNRIEAILRPVFSDNGIILDEVGIREIKFMDEYVQEIEAKQIEFVKIQTEKNRAEQAVYQKAARITQAEGQAAEQELLRRSITPEIIQKMWVEKWNGQLPSVMGQGTSLLDVSGLLPKR
ncbi:MAG: prohibitin family protein [Spirochaetaceae bacterium]|nr:MAG: prohibitin family protein [Spirochaetaceae bacterium]